MTDPLLIVLALGGVRGVLRLTDALAHRIRTRARIELVRALRTVEADASDEVRQDGSGERW